MQDNEQRKAELAEPKETPKPHPMASEMTDQDLRKSPAEQRENHAADATAGGYAHGTRAQKKVGMRLLTYGLLILGLAIILAMIIFGMWNWPLFLLGLLILFCYMALITAPFWLASTTKVAQDEAAKNTAPERTQVDTRTER